MSMDQFDDYMRLDVQVSCSEQQSFQWRFAGKGSGSLHFFGPPRFMVQGGKGMDLQREPRGDEIPKSGIWEECTGNILEFRFSRLDGSGKFKPLLKERFIIVDCIYGPEFSCLNLAIYSICLAISEHK